MPNSAREARSSSVADPQLDPAAQQSPGARAADAQAGDAAVRRMAANGQQPQEPLTTEATSRMCDGVEIYAPAGVRVAALDRAAEMIQQLIGRNQHAQRQLERQHIRLEIIPANRRLTDEPDFAALHGQHTVDGNRVWDDVRGEGSAQMPNGRFACAVGEEQLVQGTGVANAYPAGYSMAMHEFSHTLNLHAMTDDQKATIERLYTQHDHRDHHNASFTWVNDYAASNAQEYFAESTNCFFGKAEGAFTSQNTQAYTRNHNGREWLQQHDADMYALLVSLYETDYDARGGAQSPGRGPGR